MEPKLLTRDEFRAAVFERDQHKCVICKAPAQDAHHIIERRLFDDGGYYLDNGASLCAEHHIAAEQTTLSCDDIRTAGKISRVVLPGHLYRDQPYDKWGNPIQPNGTRLRGELFEDESVQKILAQGNVLGLFSRYVKYPRTFHLPWSPSMTSDDRMMETTEGLEGQRVIVMVKMDGENTSMYNDYCHARSLEYEPHPSRNMVKALHGKIAHDIPEGWRVNVENLFAKHAIYYQNLMDYALLFAIWNEKNYRLSWDETKDWAALLGVKTCPVIYDGPYNQSFFESGKILQPFETKEKDEGGNRVYRYCGDMMEGYVVQRADSFHYKDFRRFVGKYVRAGHVAPHGGHWKRRMVTPNKLVEP